MEVNNWNNYYNQIVGRNLKYWRKQRGFTLADISNLTGISRQALGRYENGTNDIPIMLLCNLASVYDIGVQHLFSEELPKSLDPRRPAESVVGANMRRYRMFNDISITHAADVLGIGESTLRYYELGEKRVPREIICKAAELYGVTYDILIH